MPLSRHRREPALADLISCFDAKKPGPNIIYDISATRLSQ